MADPYDPSALDTFLDNLEKGDDPKESEGEGGSTEPKTPDDDFDINEYMVGGGSQEPPSESQGHSEPGTPAGTTTVPVGNANNIDPFELQRQLAIEQGKNQAFNAIFGGFAGAGAQAKQEPEQPKDFIFDPAETELTDEEKGLFERSSPLVAKIAKQIANQMYKQSVRPLEEKLAQAQQHALQTDQQIKQQRLQEFHVRLHQEIPGLAQTSNTPEFQAYLKQSAPRSGGQWTVEAELTAALQNGNIAAVKEIVSGYKPTQKPGVQNVAPGRPQSGTPPTSDKGSKMLAYSKFLKAEENYNAGLISLDKYTKILEVYRDAEMAGNVDYES